MEWIFDRLLEKRASLPYCVEARTYGKEYLSYLVLYEDKAR